MNAPNVNPVPRNAKVVVTVQKSPSTIAIEAVDHQAGWRLSFSQGPVSNIEDRKLTLQSVLGGTATFLASIAGFQGAPEGGTVSDFIEAADEDLNPPKAAPEVGSDSALQEQLALAGSLNATLRAENETLKKSADQAVREALAATEAKAAALEAELADARAELESAKTQPVPPVPTAPEPPKAEEVAVDAEDGASLE